ncbi:MAG: anion transporter [Gammaproteobacteria bacterium]|nr:anion transporter [Gammaproteobacteria bacterium]
MDTWLLLIFVIVYLGMLLGRMPGLALDRTGIALLGAIAIVVSGRLEPDAAWGAIDTPTIGLLLGLMVVSAQFRLGGFYSSFTSWLAARPVAPITLLAYVVVASGVLSSLLSNDIICLAMAPVLLEGCIRRGLDPVPFLLALACSANVGSAATLIGNPQNMLIGQVLKLDFSLFSLQVAPPVLLSLMLVWSVVAWVYRGRWWNEMVLPEVIQQPFQLWQTIKGGVVLLLLVIGFLYTVLPREVLALAAAGVLLISRRMHTRTMLGLVDWQLLVLFAGLFVVNHALAVSGNLEQLVNLMHASGIDLKQPEVLFGSGILLSNLVSNVPATMLLLPFATEPIAGPVLALATTLAGNLLIIGSIANIIVVDQAERLGLKIGWGQHACIGIPVTVLTLTVAGGWLSLLAAV